MSQQKTLYYIHDPMCSWCWGFSKTWGKVLRTINGTVAIHYVLGGLAPDSDQPMPIAMQQMLQETWRTIEARIPGTVFNFDFWRQCQPRRSTYPACRAVIATRQQAPDREQDIIAAIQSAYYLRARNPADDDVLIDLATGLSLDSDRFSADLNSEATHQALHNDIAFAQQLGAQGFPSLVLVAQNSAKRLHLDYNCAENILRQVAG